MPLLNGLIIANHLIRHYSLKQALNNLTDSIREGEMLNISIQRCGLFSPYVIHLIQMGEQAGELEQTLIKAAALRRQVRPRKLLLEKV